MNTVFHNRFFAMATRCHMILSDVEDDIGEKVFAAAKNEVNRIEKTLTRFTADSEISQINRAAAYRPVKLSPEVYDILKICKKYYTITEGGFDITLRPLLEYWKQGEGNQRSYDEISETLRDKLGMNRIHLNDSEQTIYFDNERIEIDLGGYGKGYALDRVQKILQKYAVENAFVSFGESSILTLGSHPAGDHWKVGLNNYIKPGNALYTFNVNDAAVSTSSNFFVDDSGKLRNRRHVINPHTGYPVEDCITASVCVNSSAVAEILSTAFLICTKETIHKVKEQEHPCEVFKVDYTSGVPEVMTL